MAVGWAAVLPHDGIGNGLAIILALCAALGSLTAAQWQGAMDVSASFVCVMLAAAYLGPAEAFAVVVFSESVAWLSRAVSPAGARRQPRRDRDPRAHRGHADGRARDRRDLARRVPGRAGGCGASSI